MNDMVVGQGVVHRFALPAELDQLAVFQHPQLVRHSGLGDLHQFGDVAHAQFRLQQSVQDFYPGAVAEDFEQLRQIVELRIGGQARSHPLHRAGVDQGFLTAGNGFSFHVSLLVNI